MVGPRAQTGSPGTAGALAEHVVDRRAPACLQQSQCKVPDNKPPSWRAGPRSPPRENAQGKSRPASGRDGAVIGAENAAVGGAIGKRHDEAAARALEAVWAWAVGAQWVRSITVGGGLAGSARAYGRTAMSVDVVWSSGYVHAATLLRHLCVLCANAVVSSRAQSLSKSSYWGQCPPNPG